MIYIFDDQLDMDITKYGAKSYWLHYLIQNGYNVPESYFIKGLTLEDLKNKTFQNELFKILEHFKNDEKYSIAIRSSNMNEDSILESKAGHFLSYIGQFELNQIVQKIETMLKQAKSITPSKMGIVVQKLIQCEISGVIFSSNPVNYKKNEVVMSYVYGQGEDLVSGVNEGESIVYDVETNNFIFGNLESEDIHLVFDKITKIAKDLEKKLGYPVDIEWGIENEALYVLQCRPISSITSINSGCYKVDEQLSEILPHNLISSDKIQMRLNAIKNRILVADAYVFINNNAQKYNLQKHNNIDRTEFFSGYSAVIIYPFKINEKIKRLFIGNEKNIHNYTKCYRYGIKTYPKYNDVNYAIGSLFDLINNYWISVVILQEIYDPIYTGIIKQKNNTYYIEVSKGHFVPKGIVDTSQYIVKDKKVIFKKEINQVESYKIIEGHIIKHEEYDYQKNLISIDDEILYQINFSFDSLLKKNNIIEFGILQKEDVFLPYLIDILEDEKEGLDKNDLERGIISHGYIKGMITEQTFSFNENEVLNKHYYDKTSDIIQDQSKPIIYICEKPVISLLGLLKKNTGFIFKSGSSLCHLALVLREKHIPAIILNELDLLDFELNKIYELDTRKTPMLSNVCCNK